MKSFTRPDENPSISLCCPLLHLCLLSIFSSPTTLQTHIPSLCSLDTAHFPPDSSLSLYCSVFGSSQLSVLSSKRASRASPAKRAPLVTITIPCSISLTALTAIWNSVMSLFTCALLMSPPHTHVEWEPHERSLLTVHCLSSTPSSWEVLKNSQGMYQSHKVLAPPTPGSSGHLCLQCWWWEEAEKR